MKARRSNADQDTAHPLRDEDVKPLHLPKTSDHRPVTVTPSKSLTQCHGLPDGGPDDRNKPEKEANPMKYDLKRIMTRAWEIFRKARVSFAEALHRSWLCARAEPINAQRIEAAKAAAGVTEDVATWSGWQALGREVIHGSKALFGVDLIYGSKGDGAIYKARFFGASQVQPISA